MTDFIFAAYTPSTELCSLRGPGTVGIAQNTSFSRSRSPSFHDRDRQDRKPGSPVHNVASSADYVLATHRRRRRRYFHRNFSISIRSLSL